MMRRSPRSTLFRYATLFRSDLFRQERSHRQGASLGEGTQATIARGQAGVVSGGHPAAGLAAGRDPDVSGQGRTNDAEMDGVRDSTSAAKLHPYQHNARPTY